MIADGPSGMSDDRFDGILETDRPRPTTPFRDGRGAGRGRTRTAPDADVRSAANEPPPGVPRVRLFPLLCAALACVPLAPASVASPSDGVASERIEISEEVAVQVRHGRELELDVAVSDGGSWADVASRFCGDDGKARALAAWNGAPDGGPGPRVRVPLGLLDDRWRAVVLLNLFPEDRPDADGWVHVAGTGRLPTYAAGMWQVAEWFTGRGDRFRDLMRENGLNSPELRRGQVVRIPARWLHPALTLPGERSDDGLLAYGSDDRGPYAAYRLAAGEALYTAVVVRFTGRTSAEDVVDAAEQIARRSGIPDVTDIPVGYLVKIPLDELDPSFLPAGHPRRVAWEQERARMAESLAETPIPSATGLEGVVVVLDAGHGGMDLGTEHNGVWEHDYVYDVTVRVKAMLERNSAARVHMLIRDEKTGWTPSTTDRLDKNKQGTILTDPPFLQRSKERGQSKIAVNLRWYLANSIHRREIAGGADPDRIVFLSIHADALHPSVRGAMVYVPGASLRTRTYSHTEKPYPKYREVREKPTLKFSYKSRIRSEAVSRELADALLRGYRAEGLPVHKNRPVRDRIHRGRATFVPAVIRGNEIPAKVLFEVANLANREDARLLTTVEDRERIARAITRGLFAYFGEDHPASISSR